VRILWVKAGKLLPVDTGGKIRSYSILKELTRDHQVTLLSYYNGVRDQTYENALRVEFPGSRPICTKLPDSNRMGQCFHYLRNVLRPAPFAVSRFTARQVMREVRAYLCKGACDIVVCDFLAASLNLTKTGTTPVVLFQHNVETVLWQRKKSTETNLAKRLVYALEAFKMKNFEARTLRRLRHVIAVSDHDKRRMLDVAPNCLISVIPTGVDTSTMATQLSRNEAVHKIVFTGSMDWQPNIDGVLFFCRDILPLVRKEFPDAIFQVVGRNPPLKIRRLASTSIEVTGTVPSVDEYLQNATLVVVPLRIGGGTRLKIFEAMAKGRAVISTTVGAEGLDIRDGRDVVLADTPNDFASRICALLRDPSLRSRYEHAAISSVRQHDWSHVAKRFASALERTVNLSFPTADSKVLPSRLSPEVIPN
jgi:polysaccharide biosynthesis protein PslH